MFSGSKIPSSGLWVANHSQQLIHALTSSQRRQSLSISPEIFPENGVPGLRQDGKNSRREERQKEIGCVVTLQENPFTLSNAS